MDSEKVIKRDNEYVLHTYNRNPIVLEKGHGLYAEGPEGQKYLDWVFRSLCFYLRFRRGSWLEQSVI